MKDKLIVKQQLEIEVLKERILEHKAACSDARNVLNHAEQWSTKCVDFPKVAMSAIVRARTELDSI